ncbi:oligopeptide/dipeptide ABC transporter ATP-binding protein [Paramaledivibacter caminithermalis]|uniref:oligopeptide/dipeptide ABC transporter ATP-binding protein n=1 Tax=Paramaledivibacter caminithermalis TaxID=191027 RepID=UPI002FE64B42
MELAAIGGFLPDLSKEYKGCIFAPRCKHAKDKCHQTKPMNLDMENGRMVKCHLYGGEKSNG